MSIINNLTCLGFNTKYVSLSIDLLHELTTEKPRSYIYNLIKTVFDFSDEYISDTFDPMDYFSIKYTMFYAIQNCLNDNKNGLELVPDDIIARSISQSSQFINNNVVWLSENFNPEQGTLLVINHSNGVVTNKSKTTTKQLAYSIFKSFAEKTTNTKDIHTPEFKRSIMDVYRVQLNTSDTGFQSYYYASKKEYIKQYNIT